MRAIFPQSLLHKGLSPLHPAHSPASPCRSSMDLCYIVEQRLARQPLSEEGQGFGSLWMLRFSKEGDQIIRGLVDAAGRLVVKWALLSFKAASFGCLHLPLWICFSVGNYWNLRKWLSCHKLRFTQFHVFCLCFWHVVSSYLPILEQLAQTYFVIFAMKL